MRSILAVLLLPAVAFAQGTKADYERSLGLFQRFGGKVTGDRIDPTWSADGKQLWFPDPAGKGQFVLVDIEKGTKESVAEDKLPKGGIKPKEPKKGRGEEPVHPFGESEEGFAASGVGDGERDLTPRPPLHEWRGGVQSASVAAVPLTAFEIGRGFANPASVLNTPSPFMGRGPGGEVLGNPELVLQQRPRDGLPSPDGKWRAAVKDFNVVLRPAAGGDEVALSTDGKADDSYGRLVWSPDSSRLIAFKTKAGGDRKVTLVESSPKDQLQPKTSTYDYLKPGDPIPLTKPKLFDIANKKQLAVSDELFPTPWEGDRTQTVWSKDGKRFLFLYNQRGHTVMRVLSLDVESGKVSAVVNEECKTFFDYAGKTFFRYLPDTGEVLWMSERDGRNHLYRIDAKTGDVKQQVTKGAFVVRRVLTVDEAKKQIDLEILGNEPKEDPYHSHFVRVTFDGGVTRLTDADGTHTAPRYSPDGKHYLVSYSRVDLPPVTELRRTSDGKRVMELAKADVSELTKAGWKPPERFVAKGRDGETDIFGIIHRPTNFDPKKKYPVIEYIYAGPHDFHVPKRFAPVHRAMAMAELGFILVQIDGMGTNWRTKAFHDVCWKNLGDSGFPDRIKWIKAAAETRPEMDLTKGVGIYGGSAGGQSSTRAVFAHPDFYTVAVSDCGCHDNRMDKIWWNELWMSWPMGKHYAEQSNTNPDVVKQFKGKLMLTVGELDKNVDPASTMQVANALIRANKDFDLIVFPGAGHGACESPYGQRRRADFFVRHLMGVEPRGK